DTLAALSELGVSLDEITERLTGDGVALFTEAFGKLFAAIAAELEAEPDTRVAAQRSSLPAELEARVRATLEDWRTSDKVRRLWSRDSSLWTNADEARWLGWLAVADGGLAHWEELEQVAADVRDAEFG